MNNPLFGVYVTMEEEHGCLKESSPNVAPPSSSGLLANSAWTKKQKVLFSVLLSQDVWHVEKSDSKDFAAAVCEANMDDEVPEDDDICFLTIPFKSMEKQRFHHNWCPTLIVKVFGRTFPF
ncbi:unnamed protein product [Linum trigynum]|uniref:Uncharacterized protein n=1 Tax=Linum trigynum TaxID=586398 RepID=A0AAV2E4P5_9ROSI